MFHTLYKKLNTFYEGLFAVYGRFLTKYYVYIIIAAFAVNCLLSIGSYRMKLVMDPEELFTPLSGQAKIDEHKIKKLFNQVCLNVFYN
jgi:hypothetical protein